MKAIKIEATERGFLRGDFKDRYGAECSIQESSLATESCIWLGVDDANPQVMTDAGWEPVDLSTLGDVHMTTRMHLSQDDVKRLLPLLQHFADTGSLP